MGSTLLKIQPTLIHVETKKDMVFTPEWLSEKIVNYFNPVGFCLDPCRGGGAFYNHLPSTHRDWCEISEGRDFLSYSKQVDWCIGNPPYSILLEWIRHSFKISENVCYLIPLHRVMASSTFLDDVAKWGGLKEVVHVGTGSSVGFPFGHALCVVHYQRNYTAGTTWACLDRTPSKQNNYKLRHFAM
jgi:hypothetical protein